MIYLSLTANADNAFAAWLSGPQFTAIAVALITALVTTLLIDRRRHKHALEHQARTHAHELEVAHLKHELDKAMRRGEWEREAGIGLGELFRDFGLRLLQPADPVAAGEQMLAFDKSLGRYVNDLPPRLFCYLSEYSGYCQELIAGWSRAQETTAKHEAGFPFMTGLLLLWHPAKQVVENWCSTGAAPDLNDRLELWKDYVRHTTAAGINPGRPEPTEP